jgi:hypothetical protein
MSADDARVIATAALGRDPGPMTATSSLSHHVYLGADVVVKLIDVDGHSRLHREITLASHLPPGLTAPLLASGVHGSYRYACYTRVPGTSPGMHMPGVDAATARLLASDAVQRLTRLHEWTPTGDADSVLRQTLDHGGFTSQDALLADIAALRSLPRRITDGLHAIARRATSPARAVVPVHADCHWGNWLAQPDGVTTLLDFEWARFGEPLDDWFFLIRFSGPHMPVVLDVVREATGLPPDRLRAGCEIREACYLASDLRIAVERSDDAGVAEMLPDLETLIGGYWTG